MKSLFALLILAAALAVGGCSTPAASSGTSAAPVVTPSSVPSMDIGSPSPS
ncbi:MAG: hypothetical protein QOG32_168 [Chloroflexota bacterium]|nr:hypothetical protein [Chloroflexota bacterium]